MSLEQPSRDVQNILKLLTAKLDRKPREAVVRRHSAMLRELRFLGEKADRKLAYLRERGWSDDRFAVLFALNSVYQEILGPLHASSQAGIAGIGTEHPIRHGSDLFGSEHNKRVRFAVQDFFNMVAEMQFSREWMSKNTCGDLVYFIEQKEREASPR